MSGVLAGWLLARREQQNNRKKKDKKGKKEKCCCFGLNLDFEMIFISNRWSGRRGSGFNQLCTYWVATQASPHMEND